MSFLSKLFRKILVGKSETMPDNEDWMSEKNPRLLAIKKIAKQNGYREIDHQYNIRMISFNPAKSDDIRINVYYSTMTVATCLKHPTSGKTQLFRKNVFSSKELESIFKNPRQHTGKGYYQK